MTFVYSLHQSFWDWHLIDWFSWIFELKRLLRGSRAKHCCTGMQILWTLLRDSSTSSNSTSLYQPARGASMPRLLKLTGMWWATFASSFKLICNDFSSVYFSSAEISVWFDSIQLYKSALMQFFNSASVCVCRSILWRGRPHDRQSGCAYRRGRRAALREWAGALPRHFRVPWRGGGASRANGGGALPPRVLHELLAIRGQRESPPFGFCIHSTDSERNVPRDDRQCQWRTLLSAAYDWATIRHCRHRAHIVSGVRKHWTGALERFNWV